MLLEDFLLSKGTTPDGALVPRPAGILHCISSIVRDENEPKRRRSMEVATLSGAEDLVSPAK